MSFQKVQVWYHCSGTCSDAFGALEGVLGSLLPMTKNAFRPNSFPNHSTATGVPIMGWIYARIFCWNQKKQALRGTKEDIYRGKRKVSNFPSTIFSFVSNCTVRKIYTKGANEVRTKFRAFHTHFTHQIPIEHSAQTKKKRNQSNMRHKRFLVEPNPW